MNVRILTPLLDTSIAETHTQCRACIRLSTYLSNGLEGTLLSEFHKTIQHAKKLKKNEYLFRAGELSDCLFIIGSGALKTLIGDEDGHEQIIKFSIQGDILGLDGIYKKAHPTSVQAIETTYVCKIPLNRYLELAKDNSQLFTNLYTAMSSHIIEVEEHTHTLGTKNANQRLATMLLKLSRLNDKDGISTTELILPMSRKDIANYLSVAIETVSRLFTHFQNTGAIGLNGKRLEIKDLDKLKQLAT